MATLRSAAAVAAMLALVACSDPPQSRVTADGDPLGPLEALAECDQVPAATAEAPEGLLLPRGAVIQNVTPQGPLTNVTAYVPMTPVQFQQSYDDREFEILVSENEIFEAELLVSDGQYRNFLKAAALCSKGSSVLAVVAPEVDAEGLPIPQGGAPATPGSPPTTGATAAQ